jgi:hypothetical protein
MKQPDGEHNIHTPGQLDRRKAMKAGSAAILGLSVGSLLSAPVASSSTVVPDSTGFGLQPGEAEFLNAWQNYPANDVCRRIMRRHGARVPQVESLIHASGGFATSQTSAPSTIRWPWKTKSELDARLEEARAYLRTKHPSAWPSLPPGLRYVGFREDEAAFLLRWHQEYWDWCFSYEEWDKGWRYYPTCRTARELLPGVPSGVLIDFCLALFDELVLNQFEAAALPTTPGPVSFPWKTRDEFILRQRDVRAYNLRKRKAENVAGDLWRNTLIRLSEAENAYLTAWLQELLRNEFGPVRREQYRHGAWNQQLHNLVWAGGVEIEPRDASPVGWPWNSRGEFHERLAAAAGPLYERAASRPRFSTPLRPEEDRFITAWIQQDHHLFVRPYLLGKEPAADDYPEMDVSAVDLIREARIPDLAPEANAWLRYRSLACAWLKVRGYHELAVAGGPPLAGTLVYPWRNTTEFWTRAQEADRVLRGA